MKVNLLEQKFDFDKFLYEIQKFEMIKGEYPNYLVMSEETEQVFESQYKLHYVEKDVYFRHNQRHIGEIFGIPVAYKYNLQFGIVDIV